MAVLMWKCLHGEALSYLLDLCVPVTLTEGRQRLHSALSSYRGTGHISPVLRQLHRLTSV